MAINCQNCQLSSISAPICFFCTGFELKDCLGRLVTYNYHRGLAGLFKIGAETTGICLAELLEIPFGKVPEFPEMSNKGDSKS